VDLAEPRRSGLAATGRTGRHPSPAGRAGSPVLDVVRAEDFRFFIYLHLAVMTGARRSQLLALPDGW
jgi:hypothetical protein